MIGVFQQPNTIFTMGVNLFVFGRHNTFVPIFEVTHFNGGLDFVAYKNLSLFLNLIMRIQNGINR